MDGLCGMMARVAVLLVLLLPALAMATSPECAALKREAEVDADAGRHREAVYRYEELWNRCQLPVALFNIAVLQQDALRDPGRAWQWIMRYLDQVLGPSDRQDGQALLAEIEEELARSHGRLHIVPTPASSALYLDRTEEDGRLERPEAWVRPGRHTLVGEAPGHARTEVQVEVQAGSRTEVPLTLAPLTATLRIEGEVPGARVFLDDRLIGSPPLVVPSAPGRHRIRSEAKGYRDFDLVVTLLPGEALPVRLQMEPQEAVPAARPSPSVRGQAVEPPPSQGVPEPRTSGRARTHRVAGWALMGSGIGLAVLGGVLEGLAVKDNRDTGNAAAQGRWRDEETAAWVLMGTGLGALASGLAVYLTAPGGQEARIVPWGPGGPGLAFQGAW